MPTRRANTLNLIWEQELEEYERTNGILLLSQNKPIPKPCNLCIERRLLMI